MHSKLSFSSSQFQYYSTSRELRIAWATAIHWDPWKDGWMAERLWPSQRLEKPGTVSFCTTREAEITAQCPKLVTTQKCAQSVCSCLTIQTFGWLSLNNECVRKTQRNLPCRIRTILAVLPPSNEAIPQHNFGGEKLLKTFFTFGGQPMLTNRICYQNFILIHYLINAH